MKKKQCLNHLKNLAGLIKIKDYEEIVMPYIQAYIKDMEGQELDAWDREQLAEGLKRIQGETK